VRVRMPVIMGMDMRLDMTGRVVGHGSDLAEAAAQSQTPS
jgi:hypothetical protein